MVLSVGYGIEDINKRVKGSVVDARPSVGGINKSDVWTVVWKTQTGELEEYFVAEETCEVVGVRSLPFDSENCSQDLDPWRDLRPDWAAYLRLQAFSDQHDQRKIGLMDHLKWTNGEDYERGISRLWLKAMRGKIKAATENKNPDSDACEPELKVRLAQKYVLACVAGNRCVLVHFAGLTFELNKC